VNASREPAGIRLDLGLLVLRLAGFGLAYAHGWGKLVRMVSGDTGFVEGVARLGFPLPVVFAWAAALAESLGGLLVLLGLGTRVAAALCAFTMLVAAFGTHHAHHHALIQLGLASFPPETVKAWGKPEMALIYALPFVALALVGGGRFALERLLRRGKR
jgi:putative oxidoreductase